jgi:hypothetical protein
MTTTTSPLVCDMTAAPDTPRQRTDEYRRLFAQALVGRERTAASIIWRFAARPGVEAWVRDLASREAACCPFLGYTVTAADGVIAFEIAGGDDPRVQPLLDMAYRLPEEIADGFPQVRERLAGLGLQIRTARQP